MKYSQAILAAVVTVAAMSGCQTTDPRSGYTSQSLFDESIKSVQVNIFSTKEFRRGLEFELAEALVKQIEADTPYKVLNGPQADTVLEGQIKAIRQSVLADTYEDDLPAEKHQQLVVSFVWKDRRTGRILAQDNDVRVAAEYNPPVGETFFVGEQELMDKMAHKIVNMMREDW